MTLKDQLKSNYLIKKIITLRNRWKYLYYNCSYSQEGEDMILKKLLSEEYKKDISEINGFYIDIGAHHPLRLSNTYYFYKLGWKGINIDAMPNSMKLFKDIRKRDVNLELGISDKRNTLEYYIFAEPAINSFNKELSELRVSQGQKIIEIRKIETYPIIEILDKYLSPNQKIDFLTIDIEGLDEVVLASNDWKKYRPKFIIIEALDFNINNITSNSVQLSMKSINYEMVSKLYNSIIYKDIQETF